MNEKQLIALVNSVVAIYDNAGKNGLAANERGEAIKAYFEKMGFEGHLEEFLSWFQE